METTVEPYLRILPNELYANSLWMKISILNLASPLLLLCKSHLTLARVFVMFFLYHQNTALKDLNNSNIVHRVMGWGTEKLVVRYK